MDTDLDLSLTHAAAWGVRLELLPGETPGGSFIH
jgi:hypothetical protein